jgi:hypothetical protein
MNTQTFTQRRAIHAYTEARRDAIYQAERQVDAMLIHIRQNDACGCAECEDVPTTTLRQWVNRVALSLVLTLGAWLLGMAVKS